MGAAIVALATIGGLLVSGSVAGATPTYKYYTDSAVPSSTYVGDPTNVILTLDNLALSNQPFGSAEITVGNLPPTAVDPTITTDNPAWSGTVLGTNPAVIKLTSTNAGAIQPGAPLSVSFTITPTTASSITLGTVVKQSNDFSGTGNNFKNQGSDPVIIVNPVTLSFAAPGQQPSAVQQYSSTAMTNAVVYMCPAVSVYVSANGSPVDGVVVTLTNGGTSNPGLVWNGQQVSPSNTPSATSGALGIHGLATFGSCNSGIGATNIGSGYTLSANSTSASGPVPSSAFSVVQFLQNCTSDPCSTPTPLNGSSTKTTGSISASGASGETLLGSFGLGSLECDSQVTDSLITADPLVSQTSGSASGTVTMTFPKAVVNNLANNGTPLMQVCAGAKTPFQVLPNTSYTCDPTKDPTCLYPYQGLLPNCQSGYQAQTYTSLYMCVVSRSKNAANETIVIFTSDLTDPMYW